jgi:hypothetical protein
MPDNNDSSSKPVKVGLIYHKSCVHCINFKPEWEKITEKLENRNIEVIDFDHTNGVHPETTETHPNLKAEGFPTIYKIVGDGEPEYFSGERDTDAIVKWATSNTQQGGFGCGCNKNKKTRGLWNGGKKRKTMKRKSKKSTKKLKRNKHKRTVRK